MKDERVVVRKVRTSRGFRYGMACLRCDRHFDIPGHRYNSGRGRFCTRKCAASYSMSRRVGAKNPSWKGGRTKDSEGYIKIWAKNHPNCDYNGYVMEHRLVMEKELGRYLTKDEIVHHINGIRDDNRPNNLAVMLKRNHGHHTFVKVLQAKIRELETQLEK